MPTSCNPVPRPNISHGAWNEAVLDVRLLAPLPPCKHLNFRMAYGAFHPVTLLLYLIHTLTSFVSAEEGGDAIRVLHAYCYMHRLFLEFLIQHPALVSSAKESVRNFIEDPAKRHIDVSLVGVSTRFS